MYNLCYFGHLTMITISFVASSFASVQIYLYKWLKIKIGIKVYHLELMHVLFLEYVRVFCWQDLYEESGAKMTDDSHHKLVIHCHFPYARFSSGKRGLIIEYSSFISIFNCVLRNTIFTFASFLTYRMTVHLSDQQMQCYINHPKKSQTS